MMTRLLRLELLVMAAALAGASSVYADVKLATFRADVTPPIGSPLCDALCPPEIGVNDPLSARGVILQSGDDEPVVLIAVDWVGIGNGGFEAWRTAIAEACEISLDRVRLHCLHQHDAPGCDFEAEAIAAEAGLAGKLFPVEFARTAIARVAEAAGEARKSMKPISHISYGLGRVHDVASNRRIIGSDGKLKFYRYTATADAALRAMPEGLIDPNARVIGFWQGDRPIAALSYYATHPQSYYRTGLISADFVGMGRDEAAEQEGVDLHVHFNGAGGNIGAGKYNDGAKENRAKLASRLAAGMVEAWHAANRIPADDLTLNWKTAEVALPVATWYSESTSLAELNDPHVAEVKRLQAARAVAWGHRREAGKTIDVGRLRIGPIDVLHLPGELFIEYQLAAQKLRPDAFVCVAAYGDYGPGYIGTAVAYSEGGYETGLESRASRVSARAEPALLAAIKELLH